ncbi:probably inactive leucine-rich repeat receptor-like protein kinase At3g28040 [Syzygium oleosum]|uniref:probably inactive leucine-rich repeat receptor-like protein kinase At3g28040 n=1 Tax=Syzygium oleosum TaxID=219896 RepID=UPI0024B9479D|nr:probably inactive leucine-rich repeat receptor-like protein kinase At3g28040 [Syzygium oleosum]
MPKFIGSMKQLRYLDLSHSFSFATVPREWGNLTKLEFLDLHGDYPMGVVNDIRWVSHLRALKYLDMSGINVNRSGDLMQLISTLPSLSRLSLSDCGLNNFHLSSESLTNSTALHLQYLDLSWNFFEGFIPSTIFQNMTSLQHLDLHSYYRMGVVNDIRWVSHLRALKYLDMSGITVNRFGDLMQLINTLPSLSRLSLSACGLNNFHLSSESLTNSTALHLQYLDLSRNFFEGFIPSTIFQNMTSLQHLDLSSNLFNSSESRWFDNLRNLVDLNLAHNLLQSIEGGLFSFLRENPFLESLYLGYNGLHEEIFSVEGNSSGLIGKNFKRLEISYNFLQGPLPDWSVHLKNLKMLDLSYNQLHGTIPSSHGWLCLRALFLSHNQLTGNIPEALGRSQVLTSLDLSNNLLEGTIPHSLGQLQNLGYLDLSANSLRGTVSEIHFSNLSKLRYLDISYNHLAIEVDSDWIPPFNLLISPRLARSHVVL